MIGREFFDAMKEGAFFINTSRAEVVNQDDLKEAVEKKRIRAGLDVFEGEPVPVADETLRILTEYIRTGYVHNCVNLLAKTPASYVISVHHRNRVGVLAGVLDIIRESSINVEIMENTIFQGGDGACARIQIDGVLKEEDLRRIEQSSENIFSVSQVKI